MSWPKEKSWIDHLIYEGTRRLIVEEDASYYHYTTLEAARNMIETRTYLMTCEKDLDDENEGQGSRVLLDALVRSVLGGWRSKGATQRHNISTLLDSRALLGETLDPDGLPKRLVFSMTRRHDSPRHWREYASQGAGIALRLGVRLEPDGKTTEAIVERARDVTTTYCSVVRYRQEWTPNHEEGPLLRALRDVIDTPRRLGSPADIAYRFYLLRQALAGSYKDQRYSWEDEVRLLAFSQPESVLVYLPGSPKARLGFQFDDFFRIEEVIVGMNAPSDTSRNIRQALDSAGFDGVEVTRHTIVSSSTAAND